MSETEKREMERFDLELPTRLHVEDETGEQRTIEHKTKNISSNGAFIDTDSPFAVGTEVKLNITVPIDKLKDLGGKRSKIEVSGSVVRTDNEGMAICFNKNFCIMPNSK